MDDISEAVAQVIAQKNVHRTPAALRVPVASPTHPPNFVFPTPGPYASRLQPPPTRSEIGPPPEKWLYALSAIQGQGTGLAWCLQSSHYCHVLPPPSAAELQRTHQRHGIGQETVRRQVHLCLWLCGLAMDKARDKYHQRGEHATRASRQVREEQQAANDGSTAALVWEDDESDKNPEKAMRTRIGRKNKWV